MEAAVCIRRDSERHPRGGERMAEQRSFDRGFVAGMLLMLGAYGVNWFITPMQHPDASTLQQLAAGIQVVVGVGGAIWLISRSRSRRPAPLDAHGEH